VKDQRGESHGHDHVRADDQAFELTGRERGAPSPTMSGMNLITGFGVVALTFMMLMYALERRHSGFVLAFAAGCLLSSLYGFLAGTWPFGVVELIWLA
jgi:hypothetical protein